MTRPMWRFVVMMILAAALTVTIATAGVSAWTDTLRPHPTPVPTYVRTGPTK